MTGGEPAVLRHDPNALKSSTPATNSPVYDTPTPLPKRQATEVFVVGFWKRSVAAAIDCGIVLIAALAITALVSKIAGIHTPPSNMHLRDIDFWIDLVIATDPVIIMGLVLFGAIGWIYLLVFHIARGRTLGMQLLNMKVIDHYGDPPSPRRSVGRCLGYIASAATLFLGFLWVGFDRDKRALHDWISGTYVIRA